MNNSLQLTYLLYNLDEVKYSFMLSMLFQKKHTINESLFWAFELYKSKYEECLWNIITQLYYDFYYLKNISFEKTINKEYKAWKSTNGFQHIAKIVKELHKQRVSTTIFQHYYCNDNDNDNVNDNVNDNPLTQTPIDINQTLEYLKSKTLDEIKQLYKERFRFNMKKDICLFYTNQKHRWIVKLTAKLIKRKTMWIKTKLTEQNTVFICSLHEPASKPYRTLKEKRLYEINNNIGAFPLYRFNEETDVVSIWDSKLKKYLPDDVSKEVSAYLYNWEYYVRNTPFWKELFKTYNVTFKKKQISFPNNDMLDKFYDNYGFEPDEQSKETQMKSIKPIQKITIQDCFRYYEVDLQSLHNKPPVLPIQYIV